MAEADGAELQRTEQRGTEALALPAIGDRNRKLAASLIAVEGIAAFADDGIPPLPPPFGGPLARTAKRLQRGTPNGRNTLLCAAARSSNRPLTMQILACW